MCGWPKTRLHRRGDRDHKMGAVSSWLVGSVSSFQGGDRGVPPCSSARFGLGSLPSGGPVSVPPAAVRVRALLPRQA